MLNRHATELFELSGEERGQLVEELNEVSAALNSAFDAVKINYELLGNQVPHMHWHLIPRLRTDPAPREPVWTVSHDPLALTAEERGRRIRLIRSYLKR
ncbi:HIT family protein [Candidatus Nitrospira bockiana]